jgi:hypothetical protein
MYIIYVPFCGLKPKSGEGYTSFLSGGGGGQDYPFWGFSAKNWDH